VSRAWRWSAADLIRVHLEGATDEGNMVLDRVQHLGRALAVVLPDRVLRLEGAWREVASVDEVVFVAEADVGHVEVRMTFAEAVRLCEREIKA